jgi:DNA adenine methylase
MKYMGSKSRIKKEILPILQQIIKENEITTYIEPFCGGCNVIDGIVCENKIASDKNEFLIEMFKHVTQGGELPQTLNKTEYDKCRRKFYKREFDKHYPKWYIGAVGFLGSYNGRFFDGGYAKTLVSKSGTVRNYFDEAKRNIEKQLKDLQGIQFYNLDYTMFIEEKNALIYCDIPYKGVKQYDTSKNFNHDEFWEWARKMSENNIVIISELEAPTDFECIWEQKVTRTQNNKKRKESVEKLFRKYENE